MADVERTCANCGNVQTSGDFCEKCGTRMPAAVPGASAPAAAAAYQPARPAAPMQAPPPPSGSQPAYGSQPGYGAQPGYGVPQAGQYGYAGGEQYRRESGGWGKLFDFSFQGFVTPSTIKTLYVVILGLIGLYVLFNIIYVAMAGDKFSVIAFFISLFVAGLWFFATRVLFELMATVMRDKNRD